MFQRIMKNKASPGAGRSTASASSSACCKEGSAASNACLSIFQLLSKNNKKNIIQQQQQTLLVVDNDDDADVVPPPLAKDDADSASCSACSEDDDDDEIDEEEEGTEFTHTCAAAAAAPNTAITATTTASAATTQKARKSVRFSSVQVRYHNRVVGDSPDCEGVPLALGWEYNAGAEETIKVDDYENEIRRTPSVKPVDLEPMSLHERIQKLERVGYTKSQIKQEDRRRRVQLGLEWSYRTNRNEQVDCAFPHARTLILRYVA